MATTKLTLSVDKELVEKAKRIARFRKTSVSVMFARYMDALSRERADEKNLGPLTLQASGLLKLPGRKRPKGILAEALLEKYTT